MQQTPDKFVTQLYYFKYLDISCECVDHSQIFPVARMSFVKIENLSLIFMFIFSNDGVVVLYLFEACSHKVIQHRHSKKKKKNTRNHC